MADGDVCAVVLISLGIMEHYSNIDMRSYSVAGYFSLSSLFCIDLILVVFIAAAVFEKGSYCIVLPRTH